MIYYGYIIIMIIVDSCMIWFHSNRIMHLKNHITFLLMFVAEKYDATVGDLPDC